MARRNAPRRYAVGARVLVGFGRQPGTVLQVADAPSVMGEYVHVVQTKTGERKVLGSELELVPEPITNVPNETGRANLKVHELALKVKQFHDDLEIHFRLWLESLQQPIPDYPVRNIEKLREQTTSLARQLGTLRPYIERFSSSTKMKWAEQLWDIYDSAVSNDVAIRKGESIEAALPQLQQILGRLESMNPEEEISLESSKDSREKPGTVNIIYNLHGSHSRVNIQSEDRSVNVSSISEQEVFSGIREAVTQNVSEGDERKIILEKLDALERSIHSHDFLSKYKDFINTVASHLTIVAPFLPALSQMLGN